METEMIPWAAKRIKKISAKQKVRLDDLAEIRKQWWKDAEQSGEPLMCAICNKEIIRWQDLASDHETPGKMGGCRDDRPENLRPTHSWCNNEKGSCRKPKTKAVPRKPGRAMTKAEIESYLNSLKCFCGNEKGKERPCCLNCHFTLSPQLKFDLARTGAEKPTFKEYVQILQEVELQIIRASSET